MIINGMEVMIDSSHSSRSMQSNLLGKHRVNALFLFCQDHRRTAQQEDKIKSLKDSIPAVLYQISF